MQKNVRERGKQVQTKGHERQGGRMSDFDLPTRRRRATTKWTKRAGGRKPKRLPNFQKLTFWLALNSCSYNLKNKQRLRELAVRRGDFNLVQKGELLLLSSANFDGRLLVTVDFFLSYNLCPRNSPPMSDQQGNDVSAPFPVILSRQSLAPPLRRWLHEKSIRTQIRISVFFFYDYLLTFSFQIWFHIHSQILLTTICYFMTTKVSGNKFTTKKHTNKTTIQYQHLPITFVTTLLLIRGFSGFRNQIHQPNFNTFIQSYNK